MLLKLWTTYQATYKAPQVTNKILIEHRLFNRICYVSDCILSYHTVALDHVKKQLIN